MTVDDWRVSLKVQFVKGSKKYSWFATTRKGSHACWFTKQFKSLSQDVYDREISFPCSEKLKLLSTNKLRTSNRSPSG